MNQNSKRKISSLSWLVLAAVTLALIIVWILTPSEFDKMHDHYVFQELLIKYPLYELKFNGQKMTKYYSNSQMKYKGTITLKTETGSGEIYIKKRNKREEIPKTNVYVMLKHTSFRLTKFTPDKYIFSVRKDNKKIEKIKKEEEKMSVTTWILIFIVALAAAKIAHQITWRNMFKPIKKWIVARIEDWKNS